MTPSDYSAEADLEARLQSIADRYLDELQAGIVVDRQEVLAKNSDIAAALERRLVLMEMMHRLAQPQAPATETLDSSRASSLPGGMLPSAGAAEAADFEMLQPLGEGAFGKVMLARQRSLGRLVALKITLNQGDEGRTLAGLDHRHIVRVYSEVIDREAGLRLLCMQYVAGPTLAAVVKALAERPERAWSGRDFLQAVDALASALPAVDPSTARERDFYSGSDFVDTTCWIGSRLAEALAHAHAKGYLHLDVKPANVLLDHGGQPLLADFNMAMPRQPDAAQGERAFGGTLPYMAPEHLDAYLAANPAMRTNIDQRADIFSLGVVLFELLTNTRPFPSTGSRPRKELRVLAEERRCEPPAPRSLRPEVPSVLDHIVRRCMRPDRERRYANAGELAAVLEGCRELHGMVRTRPTAGPLTRTAWRFPQATAALLPLLPHLVAALVLFVYTAAWLSSHPHGQVLEQLFGKLALGYSLVVFPVTGTIAAWLSLPIWKTWVGLRSSEDAAAEHADEARQRALRKPFWGVMLSGLGWLPGAFILPLLLLYLAPDITDWNVMQHYFLSFLIAGLIALTYTEFVDQFLLLCVAYPVLWADPCNPRQVARVELRTIEQRQRVFHVLSALVPLATCMALMTGLMNASVEQRSTPAFNFFLLLVTLLLGLALVGCWLAVLIMSHLNKALIALTGKSGER